MISTASESKRLGVTEWLIILVAIIGFAFDTYELLMLPVIAGPALAEIRFFRWLYARPRATAAQMQQAIRRIGDEIWAAHYARVFGPEGYGLVSVYSHMLWCDLYLADYPLGYVIAYQVRKYLRHRDLASEMQRMCRLGGIYPDSWMQAAVGAPITVKPLLEDTRAALAALR
jgi:hypothetical protein